MAFVYNFILFCFIIFIDMLHCIVLQVAKSRAIYTYMCVYRYRMLSMIIKVSYLSSVRSHLQYIYIYSLFLHSMLYSIHTHKIQYNLLIMLLTGIPFHPIFLNSVILTTLLLLLLLLLLFIHNIFSN